MDAFRYTVIDIQTVRPRQIDRGTYVPDYYFEILRRVQLRAYREKIRFTYLYADRLLSFNVGVYYVFLYHGRPDWVKTGKSLFPTVFPYYILIQLHNLKNDVSNRK